MKGRTAKRLGLLLALAVCLGVGGLGALATTPAIDGWYRTLSRPAWTPPDAVFGPVWTLLYVLMAVAAWLVWKGTNARAARLPLVAFATQLALNAGWSWLFFGAQEPGWAAGEIVALLAAIIGTTVLFFGHRPAAGWLMVPYAAWVAFATALNLAIWRLNAGITLP